MKIGICNDHAGYAYKVKLVRLLQSKGYETVDFGTDSDVSVDYSDFAHPLAAAVESGAYTDEQLADIRALNRKGQWYWDFVFVENSNGAHNSRLSYECLEKADAFIGAAGTLLGLLGA